MRAVSRIAALMMALSFCSEQPSSVDSGRRAVVTIEMDRPVAEVDERYLSVAVDMAMVVGATFWSPDGNIERPGGTAPVDPYDFSRPALRRLARELSPALLRIGGSHADMVYYDLREEPLKRAPEPYELVLPRAQWDAVNDFARDVGFDVIFTLNAGPGPRDDEQRWQPDNARELITYTVRQGYPVVLWELGNEPNAFPLFHGLGLWIDGERLARDYAALRAMVQRIDSNGRIGGPTSAFLPIAGEPNAVLEEFLDAGGGDHLDVVLWHYYPQQSGRCPVALRRAGLTTLLDAGNLDEAGRWAEHVERLRDQGAAHAQVWLGETGNAQCGGEPGVSDAFVGLLWWLDQLGLIARRGQRVTVRQTLSGSDYGLLDEETLAPNPDYWGSLLWRRLMGTTVLATSVAGDRRLRAYAHCGRNDDDSIVLLLINLDPNRPISVDVDALPIGSIEVYRMSADALDSSQVRLNGVSLQLRDDGTVPELLPEGLEPSNGSALVLEPASAVFLRSTGSWASACRE